MTKTLKRSSVWLKKFFIDSASRSSSNLSSRTNYFRRMVSLVFNIFRIKIIKIYYYFMCTLKKFYFCFCCVVLNSRPNLYIIVTNNRVYSLRSRKSIDSLKEMHFIPNEFQKKIPFSTLGYVQHSLDLKSITKSFRPVLWQNKKQKDQKLTSRKERR